MQLSNTTDKDGLLQDCEFLTSIGDAGITGNATLLAYFKANLNNWYLKAIAWLLESSGDWNWDDTNYSDLPIATTDLVLSQEDYALPSATVTADFSTFLKLNYVSIKDGSGYYLRLTPIDEQEYKEDLDTLFNTAGQPKYYRLIGDTIKLYPAPASGSVTTSAGLKVEYSRTPVVLADNGDKPSFPTIFHRILSLGASYDWAIVRKQELASSLRGEIEQLRQQMQSFYAKRNQDSRVRIRTNYSSFE